MNGQETIVNIKLESLVPNKYQPRKKFNDNTINELSSAIKQYGVLNPILVRQIDDKYEIIAGERRVRAAKLAGLTTIPAIIKQVSDKEMAELALIENIHKENITSVEEAQSYEQILSNNNINEEKLSNMIGKSQPFILNKLRLLSLPPEVQEAVINKRISEKHAKTLLLEPNAEKQKELLNRTINEKLSVRELESIIKEQKELEKESDNMNNGTFFPNFNTNTNTNTNPVNTTLNVNNMQPNIGTPPAVEITPMTYTPQTESNEEPIVMPTQVQQTPQEEMAMPTQELSINNMQPIMPEIQQPEPVMEQPLPAEPQPTPEIQQPEMVAGMNPSPLSLSEVMPEIQQPEQTNMNEIPLFAVQNEQSQENQIETEPIQNNEIPAPVISDTSAITPEPLLFPENNPSELQPQDEYNEGNYNVPVLNTDEEYTDQELNKYYKVKKFLDENDILYKAYTNETNNCIIIEF